MDINAPIEEQGMVLLRKLVQVGDWALKGDPRAKPYLDSGAVVLIEDRACFHRDRFIDVFTEEIVQGKIATADLILAVTNRVLNEEEFPSHGH